MVTDPLSGGSTPKKLVPLSDDRGGLLVGLKMMVMHDRGEAPSRSVGLGRDGLLRLEAAGGGRVVPGQAGGAVERVVPDRHAGEGVDLGCWVHSRSGNPASFCWVATVLRSVDGDYARREETDLLILWGSNARETHPIFFHHMLKAVRRGTPLYVIDPRRTSSAQ